MSDSDQLTGIVKLFVPWVLDGAILFCFGGRQIFAASDVQAGLEVADGPSHLFRSARCQWQADYFQLKITFPD